MPVPEEGIPVDSGTLCGVDVVTGQLDWVAPVSVAVFEVVAEEFALYNQAISDWLIIE